MAIQMIKTPEKMRTVQATCDKAPAGPGKETAERLLKTAHKAHCAENDAEMHKALDAAARALA
ncbi:hypothetical protein [Roseivivax sp. CAU 1753]